MKNLLLFMLAFLLFNYSSAQESFDCGSPETSTEDPSGVYSYSIDPNVLAGYEPVVYNIFFWGINLPIGHNDYPGYYPDRATSVLTAVANLNRTFNQFNVFFKYKGYEEFDSPLIDPADPDGYYVITSGEFTNLYNYAVANGYVKENSFNVYAFGWGEGFAGISPGYGHTTISGLGSGHLLTHVMVHEIGHNLGLYHLVHSGCENVTRDPNDPNFNADTAGDRVVDTAASKIWPTQDIDPSNCSYIGNDTDCADPPVQYNPSLADMKNALMQRSPCNENYLTVGQGIRVRETIVSNSVSNGGNGVYEDAQTSVASLYEPYEGEYYNVGPILPEHTPLFQPGFDYRFVECSGNYPQPSNYYDISFPYDSNTMLLIIDKDESDYGSITHPNHSAIVIKHDDPVFFPQPRKCYNNYNRSPSLGSVMKFNDNVFNANITVTLKDSTAINDQNLIQNLDNGLYKIEKVYDDGATQETVIIKGGN